MLVLPPQLRKSCINPEATRNLLMCFLWVLKNSEQTFLRHWWSELPINRLAHILEVLYLAVSNFEYKVCGWLGVVCGWVGAVCVGGWVLCVGGWVLCVGGWVLCVGGEVLMVVCGWVLCVDGWVLCVWVGVVCGC